VGVEHNENKSQAARDRCSICGGTKITALPDRLSVGGGLDLRDTDITALPEGLKVGGKIFGGPKPPRGSIGAEAARTLRYLVVR
jgi:hypothetical protein